MELTILQCIEMKEAKGASIAGRKRLNEATKAFRLGQSFCGYVAMSTLLFTELSQQVNNLPRYQIY